MSERQTQSQPKDAAHKPQATPETQNQPMVGAEGSGMVGSFADPRLLALPNSSMTRSLRQNAVLRMQQTQGNAAVRRALGQTAEHSTAPAVQRQVPPPAAAPAPAPALPVPAAAPAVAPAAAPPAVVRPANQRHTAHELDPRALNAAKHLIVERLGPLLGTTRTALNNLARPHFHLLTDAEYEAHVIQAYNDDSDPDRNYTHPDQPNYQDPHDVQADNLHNEIYLRSRLEATPHHFRVTLVHEILHSLEHLPAPRVNNFTEAITQYMALYAVDGSVSVGSVGADGAYRQMTQMLSELSQMVPGVTLQALGRAYFQQDIVPLRDAINGYIGSIGGYTVVLMAYNNNIVNAGITLRSSRSVALDDDGTISALSRVLRGQYKMIDRLGVSWIVLRSERDHPELWPDASAGG